MGPVPYTERSVATSMDDATQLDSSGSDSGTVTEWDDDVSDVSSEEVSPHQSPRYQEPELDVNSTGGTAKGAQPSVDNTCW